VIRRGALVVDAVSGLADPATGAPVTPSTLFYAASTAKGVASTVAHVLVEQGVVVDDLRIAEVWPEFGTRGKDAATLRHVLLHTAGVPGVPYGTTVEDLCDWQHMCDVIAEEKPWWEPGTRFGYHAQTFGFLLGETVRRATGTTLADQLRTRVTAQLGVEHDVWFGVPRVELPRVARQVAATEPAPPAPPPGSPVDRAIPPGIRADATFANRPDVLHADIPSGGTMTARGAAMIYAALVGSVAGVQLVSPPRRDAMASITFEGMDEVMGIATSWAYGYSPHRPDAARSRRGSTFGMLGMNGSAAYADIETGVAVAVMRNRFGAPHFEAAVAVDRLVAAEIAAPSRSR
jgi:CubicO group peptidase (beta-lactamase class C family)